MIVPQHWAEARRQGTIRGRHVTVRRFGWSDDTPEQAHRMAEARASEAMALLAHGKAVARREPKVAYNGAEGVPIREEIVGRQGETVVTRNSYGALCLNTPNVLFADIDFGQTPPLLWRWVAFVALVLFSVAVSSGAPSWLFLLLPASGIAAWFGAALALAVHHRWRGGETVVALARVRSFVARRPDWHVRVYRTSHGLRALVLHATFDPQSDDVAQFFEATSTDALYAQMCRRQDCFRARLTPKPWRVGIPLRLRPRPGVWPVAPQWLQMRSAWVTAYDQACQSFAVCRLVEVIGASDRIHCAVADVVKLHDELTGVGTLLPLA